MNHTRGFVVVLLVVVLLLGVVGAPVVAQDRGRYWNATYNSALSLHEAAVPVNIYPVGTRIRLIYHGHSVVVHSIYGGCTCFDISDEAFRALSGSTSAGVIRVLAIKR